MRAKDSVEPALEIAEVFENAGNSEADEIWPDVLLEASENLEALAGMYSSAHALLVGVAKYKAKVSDLLVKKLGSGGAVRFGDQYLSYRPTYEKKLHQPQAVVDWLAEDFVDAVNPSHVRITDVRATAARRFIESNPSATEDEVEEHVQMIEDTFYKRVKKPAKLNQSSVSYISGEQPWVAEMPDGVVRIYQPKETE